MVDFFSSGFVKSYGLRDALILSGICAASVEGKSAGTLDLRKKYFYLSRIQIRRALEDLVQAGAVAAERAGGFTRELRYKASGMSVQQYLADISGRGISAQRNDSGRVKEGAGEA
jgi:hypothetical protein